MRRIKAFMMRLDRRLIALVCLAVLPINILAIWFSSVAVNESREKILLSQAKEFSETAGVTGVVLTKLDGTGKGGCAVKIQSEFQLPVLFAGFGEQPEDLQGFDPTSYAAAMFGLEEK